MAQRLLLVLLVVLAAGCVRFGTRMPRQVHSTVSDAVTGMASYQSDGQDLAALRLARALERVRPDAPQIEALRASAPPELTALFEPSAWGSNRALRVVDEESGWTAAMLWLPRRVVDVFDIFSVGVSFGFGLMADVHVTRGAQLALGTRGTLDVGWSDHRHLGLGVGMEQVARLGPWGTSRVYGFPIGRRGEVTAGAIDGWPSPHDSLYQETRDYWAVGARAHALLVGAALDLHLAEVADLLAGFVGFDPLGDDWLNGDPQLVEDPLYTRMQILAESSLDARTMDGYRSWIEEGGQLTELPSLP